MNANQGKIMNVMKVNETHVHAVYEKIKIRHYFRFAAKRVNIFPIDFNFTYTRYVMSEFGINFIHVTNFSKVATGGIWGQYPLKFGCGQKNLF